MIKNVFLGVAIAALSVSSAASAYDVRPAAVNLQPAQLLAGAAVPAPAKPFVRKRSNLAPLTIALIVVAVAGTIGVVAASSGGSSSPG